MSDGRWIAKVTLVTAIYYTMIAIPSATEADGSPLFKLIFTAAATIPAHLLIYHASRGAPKENHLAAAFYCMIYGTAIDRAAKNIFMVHNTALRVTAVSLLMALVYALLRLGHQLIRRHESRAERRQ